MRNEKLRPVYLVYPGLYPLLMLNYWVRIAKVPIVGMMFSGYDSKYKGKILPFYRELPFFFKKYGWRYSVYMLFFAKLGAQLVSCWNFVRKLLGGKIKIKTFAQIAQEMGIPIYTSQDFNSNEALNFLKNVNANLIVSAYNNQILKTKAIKFPKYKTINIHPGQLPNFRGLDAVFEAMYNDVPKAGVTIHYIDCGIDTGEIIAQELLRIRKDDTLFSLNIRLWMHGAKMLVSVLDKIEAREVSCRKQKLTNILYPYCSYPKKERVNEFIRRGRRLIRLRDLLRTFK